MKFNKYISTTLPYANSVPHIGHALEFILADAITQYFRNKDESVLFNIGVDEHGVKVHNKAKELDIDTKKYLDELVVKWHDFCGNFEIAFDTFYRTSSERHHEQVKKFWGECYDRGVLYKKSYSGHYCVGCESFKTETDLVDGKCPDHGTVPDITEEVNWFFKVTEYTDRLVSWLDNSPEFLQPHSKTEELRNIILNSSDISVSRLKKNVPWGVEVPGDPDQIIYVWFDALLNYIFTVSDVGSDFSEQHFIQICGPDNLRFQGGLFQAILESAGLPHTKKLLVHGTVLDADGAKISKSVGNVIDPIDQLNKYGLDAVRYYALAGLTTYGNGSWSEKELVAIYNSELADDYGNLLARVLHLIDTKNIYIAVDTESGWFATDLPKQVKEVEKLWDSFEINHALKATNAILKYGNKYINDTKPWLPESDSHIILGNLHYLLRTVTRLYAPVLSVDTHHRIEKSLRNNKKVIIFNKLIIS